MAYDSTVDAEKHIKIIQEIFTKTIIPELAARSADHDQSKFESPEKEAYDKYIPLLRDAKYGSEEYTKICDAMKKAGTQHHIEVNRHHPEHFEHGINDMTLVDIVEMFCDWYAASQRSDSGFLEGMRSNKKRFNMSEQLYQIFLNTFNEYFA